MADQDDRTEAPTAKRLEQARTEGQSALSRELVALVVLAGVAVLLTMQGEAMARALVRRLLPLLGGVHAMDVGVASREAFWAAIGFAGPVALVALAGATAATFLQTRFLVTLSVLKPNFARLAPAKRIKQLLGLQALRGAGLSLLKLAVVAVGTYLALKSEAPLLTVALGWAAPVLSQRTSDAILHLLFAVLAAQAVIAIFDVTFAQLKHIRDLRMSRNDLRDEHREMEGDPLIKRRIRQIQQQRARRRMMAAVPDATVVLTNPTHYAVALSYDRSRGGAPRVIAKGADAVAARIREVAEKSGVPVVANPPLARALYLVDLDAEIPSEHYRVVAEIIAYVWRLRGQVRPLAPSSAASGSGNSRMISP